jgi:hypothetical protein
MTFFECRRFAAPKNYPRITEWSFADNPGCKAGSASRIERALEKSPTKVSLFQVASVQRHT